MPFIETTPPSQPESGSLAGVEPRAADVQCDDWGHRGGISII